MSNKELKPEDSNDSTIDSIDVDSLPEKDRAKSLNLFYSLKTIVVVIAIAAITTGLLFDKIGAEIGVGAIGIAVATYLIGSKRK